MTQIRPRLDEDLAAAVQAYADDWHITFSAAVRILLRVALDTYDGDYDDDRVKNRKEKS
jgi:antitoxin component of RelBE/YafQ-DinJ toxin-antitoxin module